MSPGWNRQMVSLPPAPAGGRNFSFRVTHSPGRAAGRTVPLTAVNFRVATIPLTVPSETPLSKLSEPVNRATFRAGVCNRDGNSSGKAA
eukprot:766591-Hanusia_phi.AAC.1